MQDAGQIVLEITGPIGRLVDPEKHRHYVPIIEADKITWERWVMTEVGLLGRLKQNAHDEVLTWTRKKLEGTVEAQGRTRERGGHDPTGGLAPIGRYGKN